MASPYEEGPLNAKLCFIAEAPSTVELIQGRPLVGPAGKMFNSYLQQAGIARSECLIMNVSKEKLSSIGTLLGKDGLTPKGREAQADLKERLKRATPNTIMPLGALATACMVGDRRIMKLRGSPLLSVLDHKTEVIPTIHPAAAMPYKGQPKVRYYIISDMRKAKRHAQKPGLIVPHREFIIQPSFTSCSDFLRDMEKAGRFAFDIEIYNHQVSCISFSANPLLAISIPFSHDYWSEEEEAAIWRRIGEVLSDPNTEKVGQYVTFDISFLLIQNKIRTRGPILDTYIAQRIMYPEFPASLEFLCSIYTDQPYYKDDRKLWNTMDKDIKRFWRYNATDSAATLECWESMESELYSDADFRHTYELTMETLDPCLYMMTKGIQLNIEALKEARYTVGKQLEGKEAELDDIVVQPLNPNSSKQCIAYFYGAKGYHPYLNRSTGRPTCDDKALARIIRRYNSKEARLVQQIRALKKLKSTYLDLGYDSDERLRCFYNIRGTNTGRLSSSKTVRETGLNMQNLHPAFKEFLVPDGLEV